MTPEVHYYWRPGCPFCLMLRRGLDKRGIATVDHNIWEDPADAAVVRSLAHGNETVPTIVVGGIGMVNPSADEVIAVLSSKAPHLVPEDWEPPQPSRLGQVARRLLSD